MSVIINNKKYDAEYLNTPEEIQRGMMGRDTLEGCMVFNMGNTGHHSFWMKNCLIPLDIIFVNKNRITKIHKNCQPSGRNELNPKRYTGIGDHVIEFPAGVSDSFKEGDKVNMYLGSPLNPSVKNHR
jgi:uncharacterized membrane protein (UPF0127 family)